VGGSAISIRVPLSTPRPLAELLKSSNNSPRLAGRIQEIVDAEQSFVISGATGSGKTTLLRSMLLAASKSQRIVTIEDIAELNLIHPNIIALQGRLPNVEGIGEITLRDLVRQSLRMRPDRIVVGELRGAEALDWLLAVSSGHRGCATTIHAHSANEVVGRLQLLCGLSGVDVGVARHILGNSIDVIIHCERVEGRRVISEVIDKSTIRKFLKF
jgi:pilus assembly protein CpaF